MYIYIYVYIHRRGGDGQTGVSRQSAGSSRRGRRTGAVAAQAERKLKKATANLRGTIPRFEEEGAGKSERAAGAGGGPAGGRKLRGARG